MDCPECVRLRTEHARLKAAYAEAIEESSASAGSEAPIDEYHSFWNAANQAWFDSQRALLALERHKRSHNKAD
jgi:hypothetical protein